MITAVPISPHRLLEIGNSTAFDPFLPLNSGSDIQYQKREGEWLEDFCGHPFVSSGEETAAEIIWGRVVRLIPFYEFRDFPRRNRDEQRHPSEAKLLDSSNAKLLVAAGNSALFELKFLQRS